MGDLSDEQEILNLLHVYAERVDNGEFDAVGELFAHADYRMAGSQALRGPQVAAAMRAIVITYADGCPGTKHQVTNTVMERTGSDEMHTRSYFVVTQAAPGFPLQTIIAGRYLDWFERVDGVWRFARRDIEGDLVGDLSHHLRRGLPTPGGS